MTYSKSRVNKAGRELADLLARWVDDDVTVEEQLEVIEAMNIVEWWRGEHAQPLSRVAANLRYYVADEASPVVAQRLKKVPTIAHKLLREPGMKLARMADIGGVRAILPDQGAAYRVAARLRRNWTIHQYRDYVAQPKEDGYRALHLINRHRGKLIEVQLRTELQDDWANVVESISRKIGAGLKFGEGPAPLADYLRMAAEIFAHEDQGTTAPAEMFAQLKVLRAGVDTFIESLQ